MAAMPDRADRTPILFLSKSEAAASTRYRALAYFEPLRAEGFEPTHLSVRGGAAHQLRLLRQVKRAAVTVALRRTFSGPFRGLLRRAARRLVFDFDDAIYTTPHGPSPGRMRGFGAMCRRSDVVLAGNATLAEAALKHNADVRVLPTTLDTGRYEPADPAGYDPRRLVWIGSQSTRPYIETLIPTLERAAREVPGLQLRIIADFALRSDVLDIDNKPWSSAEEAGLLRTSGIGLGPLPDEPWTRGKCGFKLLQYMAAGLPTICDPVGANGEIVEHGVTGYHAHHDDGWVDAIAALCADRDAALAMGAAGRQRAIEHYSMASAARRLTALFRELLEADGARAQVS